MGRVTLSLTKGFRILVDAIDAESGYPISDGIHAITPYLGRWSILSGQDRAQLLSPMIRYDWFGFRDFWLAHLKDDRVIGFSAPFSVRPLRKQRQVMVTKLPIRKPVALSGKLDSQVPRPVENGRAMVIARGTKPGPKGRVVVGNAEWVDWASIETDGSFSVSCSTTRL